MKGVKIPRIDGGINLSKDLLKDALLSKGAEVDVDNQSWPEFEVPKEKVQVKSYLGYESDVLFVLFTVTEDEIRAVNTIQQSPVHQDSCVEVYLGTQEKYFNLEINPYGTFYVTIGAERENRLPLSQEFHESLVIWTDYPKDLTPENNSKGEWEVITKIPISASGIEMDGNDLKNQSFIINLYKCGDKLKHPHFLSWSPIGTKEPDFMQSSYFGEATFV